MANTQPQPAIHEPQPIPGKASLLQVIAACQRDETPLPDFTPETIDACIAEFDLCDKNVDAAMVAYEAARKPLLYLVQQKGSALAGADSSLRLAGLRNEATVTTGNTNQVNNAAVETLAEYLSELRLVHIFDQLFAVVVKYTLLKDARKVLAAVKLPQKQHEKILSLFGRCFDQKAKAPSLKVAVITPAKPKRAPRAGKAAA